METSFRWAWISEVNLALGHLAQLEAERQILINRHVRPQVVALEYHCGRTLLRRQADDALSVNGDVAARHVMEAADGAQDGRFAAARGAKEGDNLTLVNIQVDMFDTVALSYFLVISFSCSLIFLSVIYV